MDNYLAMPHFHRPKYRLTQLPKRICINFNYFYIYNGQNVQFFCYMNENLVWIDLGCEQTSDDMIKFELNFAIKLEFHCEKIENWILNSHSLCLNCKIVKSLFKSGNSKHRSDQIGSKVYIYIQITIFLYKNWVNRLMAMYSLFVKQYKAKQWVKKGYEKRGYKWLRLPIGVLFCSILCFYAYLLVVISHNNEWVGCDDSIVLMHLFPLFKHEIAATPSGWMSLWFSVFLSVGANVIAE